MRSIFLTPESIAVDNVPAHNAEVVMSGNDTNQRAGERKEYVKRCSVLGVALADDGVSLSKDAPLGLERVVLPHANRKARDVLLLI
jgi:hypothetical protein